jgi:hypothetical protein
MQMMWLEALPESQVLRGFAILPNAVFLSSRTGANPSPADRLHADRMMLLESWPR